MNSLVGRTIFKVLIESTAKSRACLQLGSQRCMQTKSSRMFSQSNRMSKPTPKRVLAKQCENVDTAKWSVIAYSLSEELEIDKVQRLLANFKEYHIVDLPDDLREEAVMFSLNQSAKFDGQDPTEIKSLHDVFLFREGSIVFWGVPYDQQRRVLLGLSPLKVDPWANEIIQEEREHIEYELTQVDGSKSRLNRDIIKLVTNQDMLVMRLDQFAISHAIALSVRLGVLEALLSGYIESIGWVTSNMKTGKEIQLTRDQVFRKTGEIYELKHRINLGSDLLDLPDIYWDRPDQETLFLSLTSFLNLKRRISVINDKLNNCCELMNLLANHMNDKHHIRLEWMIIILIMVEVLFEVASFL